MSRNPSEKAPQEERKEGEIVTLPDGSVIIGAPTATIIAPVSVPGPEDEEVND